MTKKQHHHLKSNGETDCGLPIVSGTSVHAVWTDVNCPACWQARQDAITGAQSYQQAIADVLEALDTIRITVDDSEESFCVGGNISRDVINALKAQLDNNGAQYFNEDDDE